MTISVHQWLASIRRRELSIEASVKAWMEAHPKEQK